MRPIVCLLLCVLVCSGRIAADGEADAQSDRQVLVSRQALARAHLAVGDLVTLAPNPSGAGGRQFRIAGAYEPTPDPMKFNVERMEVLPFHQMGKFKWERLGILYQLADTEPPTQESVEEAIGFFRKAGLNAS